MKREELIEDGIILDFTVSDEALENAAADRIFSLATARTPACARLPMSHSSRSDKVTALRPHLSKRQKAYRLAAGSSSFDNGVS
jgi:hypothetical protein